MRLVFADMGLMGTGLGFAMLSLLLAVQHSVPRSELGVATSLNLFARSIGGAVGVAIMGAILSAGWADRLVSRRRARKAPASPASAPDCGNHLIVSLQRAFGTRRGRRGPRAHRVVLGAAVGRRR